MGNNIVVDIPFLKHAEFCIYFEGKYNSCWCGGQPENKGTYTHGQNKGITWVINQITVMYDKNNPYIMTFYFPSNNSIIEKHRDQCKSFLIQQGFSIEGFPFQDYIGQPTKKPKKKVPDVRLSSSKKREQKPKTCRYCGKKGLSPRATMCPNCGEPLQNK